MGTVVQRTPMTFNLRLDLIESLNKEAKKNRQSLDSFIENILMEISFDEPNEDTVEAIKELRSGNYAGELDVSGYAMFIKSLKAIK